MRDKREGRAMTADAEVGAGPGRAPTRPAEISMLLRIALPLTAAGILIAAPACYAGADTRDPFTAEPPALHAA